MAILEVNDIKKNFGGTEVLKGISFSLEKGEVLRVIKGLKSSDSTMIVVTHEMEFARDVADKIIFMAEGVIEEEGPSQEIFSNPQSEKLKSFLKKSLEKI